MIAHTTLHQVSPEAQEHRDAIQAAVDAARREVWEKMCPVCYHELNAHCMFSDSLEPVSFSTCPRLMEGSNERTA